MNRTLLQTTAILLLVVLNSCATRHDPAVAQARNSVIKTRTTYLQGAAIGAIGGAGAGAIIGNQTDSSRGAETGALIGAGVGALAGLAYAHHVVKQRQHYANAAAYLSDCTRIAEEQRSSVQNYNATLDNRADAIRSDDRLVQGTLSDSQDVLTRLREETQLQEEALAQARREGVGSGQIQQQRSKISALKSEERRLVSRMDQLSAYERQTSLTAADKGQ